VKTDTDCNEGEPRTRDRALGEIAQLATAAMLTTMGPGLREDAVETSASERVSVSFGRAREIPAGVGANETARDKEPTLRIRDAGDAMALTTEPALTMTGAETRSDVVGGPVNASERDSAGAAPDRPAGEGLMPAIDTTGRTVAEERTGDALEPKAVTGAPSALAEAEGANTTPAAPVVGFDWRTLPLGGSATATDNPKAPTARDETAGETVQLTVASVETEMGEACGVLGAGDNAAAAAAAMGAKACPSLVGCCAAPIPEPQAGEAS